MNFKPLFVALICSAFLMPPIWGSVAITPNKKFLIKTVLLKGNIRLHKSNQLFSALHKQKKHLYDPKTIEATCKSLYRTGFFESVSYKINRTDKGITLIVTVIENPVIAKVTFKNCTIYSPQKLQETIQSRPTQLLNYKIIQSDISALKNLYKNNGFTQFTMETVDFSDETKYLQFQCIEGAIKERRTHGLSEKNKTLVEREFNRFDFSTFNLYEDHRLRATFISTDFFSTVSYPKLSPSDNQLILDYYFSEKKFNYFDLGIEQMRDEDAIAIFFQLKLRNMFLYSDYFSIKTQIQTNDDIRLRSYSIDYMQPWLLNEYPFSGKASLWTQFRKEPLATTKTSYGNKRVGGSLSTEIPFNKYLSALDIGFKHETVTPYLNIGFTPYKLNALRLKLTHDTRLSILNAKKGYFISTSLERGGSLLGASVGGIEYSRILIEGGYFLPLSDSTTFTSRLSYGQFLRDRTTGIETFESEGFPLGGGNTLRGTPSFYYIDDQRFLTNIELRHDISDTLQGAIFLDAGVVYDQQDSLDLNRLTYGMGFGVRFLTGVIPLRLDLGFGEDVILHFNVGQLF